MVRRLLDPDRATGQRRFTDRAFRYPGYQSSDLAYAITGHSAQGATVHTGIALVTGTEDRQWLYPAMTRGTDTNLAFVFTTPARPADPQPGTRPAPELDRYDRIRRERDGFSARPGRRRRAGQPGPARADRRARRRPGPRRRRAVRLRRPGGGTWPTPTTWASSTRSGPPRPPAPATTGTATWCMAALPPGYRQDLSPQARWLFRTLRAAELAGLDPAEVIRTAIASRDLAGARDIAAVLDARIRPRVHPLLPQPQGPWASRVPRLPDPGPPGLPGRDRGHDGRPHPAPRPARRPDRPRLGGHRPRPGTRRPGRPPGLADQGSLDRRLPRDLRLRPPRRPDRTRTQPRHTGPAGRLAPGLRRPRPGRRPRRPAPCPTAGCGCSATPTPPRPPGHPATSERNCGWPGSAPSTPAWAPSAPTPKPQAARKAGDHDRAGRHEDLAASYRALRDLYQQREHTLAQAMADRQDWEHATAASRHLAIAADAELRRRHPGQKIEPLRSAEPAPVTDTERDGRPHPRRPPGSATLPHSTRHSAQRIDQRSTDDAPQGPGLGRPRRDLSLLVGAAPGCDLAAP